MGCGASEPVPAIEDLKNGENLRNLKDLKMFEAPDGKKVIAEVPADKLITVIDATVTEGPSFTGFIKASTMGVTGYIALWQCELKQQGGGGAPVKGPKNGLMKRDGAAAADGLAKAAPAAGQPQEKAMGA